jgi:GxxExxY protein
MRGERLRIDHTKHTKDRKHGTRNTKHTKRTHEHETHEIGRNARNRAKHTKGQEVLRIKSPLAADVERLVHKVIGRCIVVHRELGPGLLEVVYRRAMCVELEDGGLAFECEKRVPVLYRNTLLGHQRLDIVVNGDVLLELKAVERLAPIHHAQVMSYMRISRLRVGLLVNFNVRVLPDGLRRIVL